jgi:hypothetical protein
MDYYFPYQNNTYLTYPYSLYFTNFQDDNLHQWMETHSATIEQHQNNNIGPECTWLRPREEKLRENIII